MVIIGLYVRLKLIESASFQKVQNEGKVVKLPLGTTFRLHWRRLILGTFIMFATYVLFYFMTAFTLTYGTAPSSVEQARARAEAAGGTFTAAQEAAFVPGLGMARTDFLWMLIIGVVFFGIFTIVSGPLAERFGRRKMLLATTVGIAAFGLLWAPLFGAGTVGAMALLIIGFTLMGLTFGPMAAVLPELFPTNVRYTGSAVAYNVSSMIGAAPASFIAVALWQRAGGSTVLVGAYLSVAAVATFIALLISRETRDHDYENDVA